MSHKYFVKGFTRKTIEENMKIISNYIENSDEITDSDKHFLKCSLYVFYKLKRTELEMYSMKSNFTMIISK